MKFAKYRSSKFIIIAILSILMTTSIILVPNVNAHTPQWSIPTYAFCNVAPDPAGVGQSVNVGFWLAMPPPDASGPYGDRWMNMTVKVTNPNGNTQILGPFTSDDTGGTHTEFTPAQVGNYTFQMTFSGQTLAGANLAPGVTNAFIGDYYGPSTSNVATLTVQAAPVPFTPQAPLPTNYWSRPIESVNNDWYSISGNWLGLGQLFDANTGMYNATCDYNAYSTAPTTAHILWTKPEAFGGLIGGEFGYTDTSNYYAARQYERMFAPVIMQGILYYTEYPGSTTTPTAIVALNLQTGQTLWRDDGSNYGGGSPTQSALASNGVVTVLRCGQILDYVSPNQYGALAYIWTTGTPAGIVSTGTAWNMFDAFTGTYILSIVNGSAMSALTEDPNGNLVGYYVNNTAGTQMVMGNINDNIGPAPKPVTTTGPSLNEWNSTECIMAGAWSAQAAGWQWKPPQNGILPFKGGITWTVPLATNIAGAPLPVTLSIGAWGNAMDGPVNSGVIILWAVSSSGEMFFNAGYIVEAGYSTSTGAQLWVTNRTETPYTRVDFMPISNGVFVEINQDTSACTGYNVYTGALMWGPITLPNADPYNSIGSYYGQIANNMLYITGFGGNIYAMNILTGKILWETTTTELTGDAGSNSPYGVWPVWAFGNQGAIAGGFLFLGEGHEYSPPMFRGASEVAINITNGQPVWSILAFNVDGGTAISDGIMTCESAYDNQIYAYGMGPSATTIAAPDVGVSTSTPVTITGTVTDISSGSQQQAVAANFPHGLPCVSDASMTQFMETVYEQQPMPTNITGVPVTINVVDSNNNYRTIGTTTTTASGFYSFNWKPDIVGNFTVTATFAGTQSYYGSSAQAAFYANAPSATQAPTATPVKDIATMSGITIGIAAAVIAIIIAIAIVGILLLRKKT